MINKIIYILIDWKIILEKNYLKISNFIFQNMFKIAIIYFCVTLIFVALFIAIGFVILIMMEKIEVIFKF